MGQAKEDMRAAKEEVFAEDKTVGKSPHLSKGIFEDPPSKLVDEDELKGEIEEILRTAGVK